MIGLFYLEMMLRSVTFEFMKKERVTAYIDKDVKAKLEKDCDGRSLSNHAGNILTKHIQKREHSHTPKHETK